MKKETTIKLERLDICDLMLACVVAKQCSNGAMKWDRLHKYLKAKLDELDAQLDEVTNN